jgi:hypothetical protein
MARTVEQMQNTSRVCLVGGMSSGQLISGVIVL